MKKLVTLTAVLAIILTTILSLNVLSSINGVVKGNHVKIPEHAHSYTKAICNSENLCQDYEVFCKEKKVIRMNPITGAVVKFSESWKDPRDKEARNKFC